MKYIGIIASILFLTNFLQAQDSQIAAGLQAFQQEQYDKAIIELRKGLSSPDNLKDKKLLKANVYLTDSYIRAYQNPDLNKQFPDALLKAYDHLLISISLDTEEHYRSQISALKQNLWFFMYNEGANYYNNKEMQNALLYFGKSANLREDDYNTQLMLGYTYWNLKRNDDVVDAMRKCLDLYFANPTDQPDANILSAGIILASIYDTELNDPDKALEILRLLSSEFPESDDLKRLELNIYNNHPDLQAGSYEKFEKAITENPDDISIKLVYAQMLIDDGQVEKGLELYWDVHEKDPDNIYSNVNLGSYYINQAAKFNKQSIETLDDDEYEKLTGLVAENLKIAYPFMVKLTELEPNEIEWVQQLVTITSYFKEYAGEVEKWNRRMIEIKKENGQ